MNLFVPFESIRYLLSSNDWYTFIYILYLLTRPATMGATHSNYTGILSEYTRLKRFGWFDAFIILFVITGIILTIPALGNHTPKTVFVYHDNRIIATYPLAVNRTFPVNGTLGKMTVTIENGTVGVSEANCPLGICKKTGKIRHPHAQIVCAPNHIVISINSTTPDTIDAIVR